MVRPSLQFQISKMIQGGEGAILRKDIRHRSPQAWLNCAGQLNPELQ